MTIEKQKVYLGRSSSGLPGWFTAGIMAHPLTEEQYTYLVRANRQRQNLEARKLGFEWDNEVAYQHVIKADISEVPVRRSWYSDLCCTKMQTN